MTAAYDRRRESRAPALAAALVLHAGLFLALVSVSRPAFLPTGSSVPINIVATGPTTDSRPAEPAPIAQEAQVETPVPQARAPTPPPAPPRPIAAAKPPTPAPAPSKPAKDTFSLSSVQADIAQKQSFSLSALQAEVAKATRSQPARPAFARRGPTRAETAPVARVDAGSGVSQSDIAGLSDLLQRLWNPDCGVEDRVVIPVKFTIGFDGRIQGRVNAGGRDASSDPVVFAAARRAVDAVHQAAPYAENFRGLTVTVRFDASKACARRN
jgi:type IV secretory pathway VirB10-like protein